MTKTALDCSLDELQRVTAKWTRIALAAKELVEFRSRQPSVPATDATLALRMSAARKCGSFRSWRWISWKQRLRLTRAMAFCQIGR